MARRFEKDCQNVSGLVFEVIDGGYNVIWRKMNLTSKISFSTPEVDFEGKNPY